MIFSSLVLHPAFSYIHLLKLIYLKIVKFLIPLTPVPVVFSRVRRLSADEMLSGRPVKPPPRYAIAKYLKLP